MRVDDRDGDLRCPFQQAGHESLVELAHDDGMVSRGFSERAEAGYELVLARLGLDLEADTHQRLGDGNCGGFVAGLVGKPNLRSEFTPVLSADLIGDLCRVVGRDTFDDAQEEFGEEVVAAGTFFRVGS